MIAVDNMKLYKRNGVWYVSLPGNRRKSLKTRDKQVAERLFRQIKRQVLQGNVLTLDRSTTTLAAFAADYARHCRAHKKAWQRDEYSVRNLVSMAKDEGIDLDKPGVGMLMALPIALKFGTEQELPA